MGTPIREIALDTETTGLDPHKGAHRIVEIGCIELMYGAPTGRFFHAYMDPERDMPREAQAVHGLSIDFLRKHPPFRVHVKGFLEFVGDSPLVIHNAAFDMKFIQHHLENEGHPPLPNAVVDTMLLARRKFPGAPASLDHLCKRFSISLDKRTKHGALVDAELLANVYLELLGRQPSLFGKDGAASQEKANMAGASLSLPRREPRVFEIPAQEIEAHQEMLRRLQGSS